jgi:hypothetical protein
MASSPFRSSFVPVCDKLPSCGPGALQVARPYRGRGIAGRDRWRPTCARSENRTCEYRSVFPRRQLNQADEAVAAPGYIYDEPIAIAPIAQRATQRGNMDCKVGRLDKRVRPDSPHQFLLADQLTGALKQHNQDFQSATPKAHWLVAFEQKKLSREQAKRAE